MKLFQLGKGVYEYYTKKVKGNQSADHLLVQKKLTRNIQLALSTPVTKNLTCYIYGNLHIFVRKNRITSIRNIKMDGSWFVKDKEKYDELTKLLGIDQVEVKKGIAI
jgi:hypothetical protein